MDEQKSAGSAWQDAGTSSQDAGTSPRRHTPTDFALMFELAGVGMAQVDPHTHRFLRVNHKLSEMTGYSVEELLQLTTLELTHPDDREPNLAEWAKTVSGENPRFEIEQRFLHKDGQVIWVSVTATVIPQPEGQPAYNIATIHDITERKRTEANLAFLAEVSQDLVDLSAIKATMDALGAKIGRHFGVKWCMFAEHADTFETAVVSYGWNAEGATSLKGLYRMRDFLSDEFMEMLLSGEPLVVNETQSDPRVSAEIYGALGIRSFIIVPLVREREWRFQISIIDDKPREWRKDEVDLIQEITNHIWVRLERARAEEALRASERRLQRMMNVPRVGVLTFDHAGKLLHANDSFLQMVGYDRSEFEAKRFTWRDFTPSEYVEASERVMENLLKTGRGGPYEKEYLRKDGSRIWLMFVAADLGDGTIVEYAIDVSDRKHAEQALLESERRLRLALAAGRLGTWHFDFTREVGMADARTWEIFGRTGQETMSLERWTEAIHPADREKARREFEQALKSGSFNLEYRLLRPDGEERWVRATGSLTPDAQGQPLSLDGVITDITERRWAEGERAWLASIVESSSDAIVSFDLDRKILSWNPAAEQMFGYTAAEALGRPLELFVPPGLEAEPAAILERVWRGEHVNQYDTLRLHKNGTPVEVTLTVSPIKNDRGEVVAATTIVQDIRQRKRTERALRESEERYRELVEQVRDHAIFSTDPQGIITTWNEGCQKLLGYAQGEFIGMDFCHLFTPEDRQADIPLQELQTAARQGSCSDDRWMVRKGGERFWASGTTNAVREPSGKLSGFTKVMRDLTAQMQAETALRQSQERLALTLEAGGLGIWDSDLLRRRTYWSPEQERLFGLEPGGFDGHFSSRLHPEDRRRVLLRLREALEGGGNYQDEYRVIWPDGTVRWLAARGRVYRDQEGRAVRILGVNFDITERRRAESALQESEKRFRAMADSTPVMIWVTDPKGRVEFVNRAYTEFFGVSAEHVRQNGWQPLVHPEDQEGYTRPFLECLRERRTFWGQARVRHRSGAWRWVASYAAPRFSASGEFLGMVGSSPDISEIKEAEERLREAVETQRRFVADASHELRAPLASVLGNLELLRRYPDMPEEDHQLALHDAYSEARRMSRLVHDLLALARGDGGLRLRWQTVQLDTLLAEAIRQTSALSQEHHFVPALEPVALEGDPDRLKELLLILLDNALKYTPPGGTIRLELKQTERHAELRVSDTGIGIAPEDLPHVFERFYRADRARVRIHDPGDPGGTGLGLSIAKQIVEAHQGKIGLESQLGRGTTVWVLLPLS